MSKITHNTGETTFDQIIGAGNIYVIPYFQRPYKWTRSEIEGLVNDIGRVADHEQDSHFCGAVIIAQQPSKPSDPNAYEIVDGQQRLTSVFIVLCAIITLMAKRKEGEEARKLFQKYILHTETYLGKSNAKVQSSQLDRKSMNDVIEETRAAIIKSVENVEQVRDFYALSTSALAPNRTIVRNYHASISLLESKFPGQTTEMLQQFLTSMLTSLSVVQIDVIDPTTGPIIFDRLNSKQKPMTIGDLVKNAIFQRAASKSPTEVEKLHDEVWMPFFGSFQDDSTSPARNLFDNFFFPYGLVVDPTTKKSEVFNRLQKDWESSSEPENVIKSLRDWQPGFMDIVAGKTNNEFGPRLRDAVSRTSRYKLPSSALPFLLQAYRSAEEGKLSEEMVAEAFEFTEAFLVRRAICGVEPTGLHALFKDLWPEVSDDLSSMAIASSVKRSKTIFWPDDSSVVSAVKERPLYKSRITNYILGELNKSAGGDVPSDKFEIEHILPQRVRQGTYEEFSQDERKKATDLLANLLPLSEPMNPGLGNSSYEEKRECYKSNSMFKVVRQFADRYAEWNPKNLSERGEELANWAISRWSLPN